MSEGEVLLAAVDADPFERNVRGEWLIVLDDESGCGPIGEDLDRILESAAYAWSSGPRTPRGEKLFTK